MTVTAPDRFGSLDDALGPAAGRYFGDGYRAVRRSLGPIEPTGTPGALTSSARLRYPQSWSVKDGATLVPHLSSIDAVVLAGDAALAVLTSALGLGPGALTERNIVDLTVVAGTAPTEDLTAVPLTLTTPERSTPAGSDTRRSTVGYRLGGMRGTVTVVHPPAARAQAVHGPISVDLDRDGTLRRRVVIDDLVLHDDGVSGVAEVTMLDDERAPKAARVSMIDGLVGAAQLAQIALYHLDRIDRSTSNTLWMRKLRIRATERPRLDTPLPVRLAVSRSSVVQMGGAPWRSASLDLTEFGGITVSCLAAHQLPNGLPDGYRR